jgi:predicted phage terminase large subunit-like protein
VGAGIISRCHSSRHGIRITIWASARGTEKGRTAATGRKANCQAAAVLIEWFGYGQTLFENLRRHFRSLNLHLIAPDGRSKTARLLPHIDVIQSGRIRLPQDARWREAYACEFEQFPHGPFDDQVDATTQFLDFMLEMSALEKKYRSGVLPSPSTEAGL